MGVWFKWLFRGAERDQAYARQNTLRQAYGDHGNRIIKLSARTDLLRKSAGSTKRSFEFVEKTFVTATMEYSRVGVLIDNLAAGLENGRVGDFTGAEAAVKGLGPKLDELDQHLTKWESRWEQVPREIEDTARSLADLKRQLSEAEAMVGTHIPLDDNLDAMSTHLERVRSVAAEGNPIEAGHLLDDLAIAMKKVATEVGLYLSGMSAIIQVEQGLARIRELATGTPVASLEETAALVAAEALLPRLRPALSTGNLEQFQQDLLQIQKLLSAVKLNPPR